MTTVYEINKNIIQPDKTVIYVELRGLSTDGDKPTTVGDKTIGNGSTFIEMDTGKIYFYDLDNEQWREV